MTRILITGMFGVGKSTLLAGLSDRGHVTVDTDYDAWKTAAGLWDEERMSAALNTHTDIVFAGTVENQGAFYDRFDHVVLLSAPLSVIIRRVMNRTDSPYGRTAAQRAEIEENLLLIEPLLRQGATMEIDARGSMPEMVGTIESLLAGPDVSRETTSFE